MINCLIFHKITKKQEQDWTDFKFSKFLSILDYLQDNYIETTTLSNFNNIKNMKICLTFDDGFGSDYKYVLPELLKRKMVGVFFIVPNLVGQRGYLNWEQIKKLKISGMEIGSHGMTHHLNFNTLSKERLIYELQKSKEIIESNICSNIVSFSYPGGNYSEKITTMALNIGYKYICTSKPGLSNITDFMICRNSVYKYLNKENIKLLIKPSKTKLIELQMRYYLKEKIKNVLGFKYYNILKNKIIN